MDVLFEVAVFSRHLAAAQDAGQICVLGNAVELGAWDATRAVPLQLVEESTAERKFATTVSFPSEREFFPIEYKYVIKDVKTNEVVSWEAIPGNRTFTLTGAKNAALGKPAKQSSTFKSERTPNPGPRPASLGNNGNHNGFQESRCARTTRQANQWWCVDLKEPLELSRLNLWKAMTYHEQPKRAAAQPPASHVATVRSPSALPPPPAWIVVSTEDLGAKTGEDLVKLLHAPGYLPQAAKAFALEFHEDARVETLDLGGVTARHVRLQYDSASHAVQFAELEVFAKGDDTVVPTQILKRADGFFGVDAVIDGDLDEYIDSEWVDPLGDKSLIRVWVGSYQKDVPAIQWFDGSPNTRQIHVALRHQVQQQMQTGDGAQQTAEISVDSRGASLLDKDGTEFRESLKALLHNPSHDLNPHLNSTNATSFEAWLQRFGQMQLLGDDYISQLRSQAKTIAYKAGEALLHFGERTRKAFFVLQGEVEVTGPPTVTGALALGSLTAGSSFNDLALFSSWPERNVAFRAKGPVTVNTITFDALKLVLGEEKLSSLRHHLLRERHALDSSPTIDGQGKLLIVDSDRAQVFRTKVPTSSLSTADTAAVHRLTIEFYEVTEVGTSISSIKERGAFLGSTRLLPTQLDKHGEGFLTLPILSRAGANEPISIVGQVSLHYLVVCPFVHPMNDLSNVWRTYWRERTPLSGGHRGMGRHFNQVGDFRKALTRENTLASFILAGRSGADFVEFDVQLTKDYVPVLYHDFIFRVGLEDKFAWSQGARAEQHQIALYELTYRELTRSQTSVGPKKEPAKLKRLAKKHWNTILGRAISHGSAKTRIDPARGVVGDVESNDDHLVEFYPRLEDLLKHVPPEIGLNIEIKYPDTFKRSAYRFSSSFAMNYYIDTILKCVFDNAGVGRRIFFSCFDPDLVVALKAKQATYPVFFLTYGRVQPTFDARLTIQFAHNFAKMEKLRGIVSNSDEFLTQPECVELVKRDGLVLMTWGDQNTSHECVQLQKRHAIDGVISDNIGDLTWEDKKALASAASQRDRST